MHAALIFQAAERALPRDGENRLLHATQLGHAGLQHLGLPAVPLGVSHIHPHQHRAEQRRLFAARAAADFHHDVPLRVRILRQKQKLNFAPGRRQPVLKLGQLLLRHFSHVGLIEQRARLLLRVLQFGVSANGLIQRLKLAVLAHQLPPFFLILHHRRVGEQHAQLLHARVHPIQFFQHAPSFFAPTTRQFCP